MARAGTKIPLIIHQKHVISGEKNQKFPLGKGTLLIPHPYTNPN